MFECKICNRKLDNLGNLNQHSVKCSRLLEIKDEIINLYVNENYSFRDLRKKFKIQPTDIKKILTDKTRSLSESNKIARKKYPELFKHTEETKKILREKRLEFMKNNPDKTAWRLSNISYPERLFIEYLESNGLNKKYSIIREYSIFPYFIDFAFPNEMIAVEIDGSQHLLPERKKRDNDKDNLLNGFGWTVIRISEKEIKTNIKFVFDHIIKILNEKPKINNIKIGIVVHPKKYTKKERNESGFTENQIRSIKGQRRVNRPPFEDLKKIISENGYTKTGKMFGVSGNSIYKWIKSYEKGLY
jgi:very-short-patch-repair endonuclease